MELDYDAARFWWEVAMTLGLVGNFVYQVIVAKSKANRAAIDRVDDRLAETVRRVDHLEQHASSAPTHDDLSVLHERVTDLAGAVRELTGVMGAVRRSIDRVETYLLENKK